MKKKSQLSTRTHALYRDPNNPFAAWDEEGRPCLPMTIDDDSPSPGIPPSLSWAIGPQRAALGWDALNPPRHPQTQIQCGGLVVNVDSEMARIVELLNRSGIPTLASCCEEENGYGYVMFALADSKRFLRFWETYMEPQGWELPAMSSFALRDGAWRAWMKKIYPPPVAFAVDEFGHTFTACWLFPAEQLEELRNPLCDALAQALRSRVGGRSP